MSSAACYTPRLASADFPDGVAAPRSPWARLDARAKLGGALAAVLAVSTYPVAAGWRPAAALAALAACVALARLPPGYPLRRCLAATPFVAMAAALPWAAGAPDWPAVAAAVALKAYSAVLACSLLTATTPVSEIVGSLRSLGAPRGFALAAALMFRYLFALRDEWRRMERARELRAGGRRPRVGLRANQLATVFVRGCERAERVSQGLIARGFQGEFPQLRRERMHAWEFMLALLPALAALAPRLA